MKKFTKIISLILAIAIACMMFAGCNDNTGSSSDDTASPSDSEYKIGIIQYVSHPSLDNCYNGIVEAISKVEGVTYERQIGSDATAESDCQTYAQNYVANNYDMIIAIATPAAASAFAAVEGTDIPVVFCAVNDPVAAELVKSNENPGYNCTGTSDVLDLSAQIDLIQSMQPDVKSIGILYTTSEANSISNLEIFKNLAKAKNIEVDAVGIQNDSDIPSAAAALASRVDCINNFTDNKVVNNLSIVLEAANTNKIPVYGSEIEQVKNGCLAAVSIDYVALGKVTGDMAIDIKNGASASTMSVKTISEATPVVNTEVLENLSIKMPEKYSNAETVTTNK